MDEIGALTFQLRAVYLSSRGAAFDDRAVEKPRKLSERSFPELLTQVVEAGVEGFVALRDRDGVRHGIWVQRGYVVGAHVAGRFDPLLWLLAAAGRLDGQSHRRCLGALPHSGLRSGAVAHALAGVSETAVHETLQAQLLDRYLAILALAESHGHDAQLEPGVVPSDEQSARMPLGTLRRRAEQRTLDARERARKALRALAKTHHPDRHPESDPALRDLLTREFAEATAAYHGFR